LVIDGKLENLYVLDAILPTCQIRKETIILRVFKAHSLKAFLEEEINFYTIKVVQVTNVTLL